MLVLLAQLPTQLVEFRRLKKLLDAERIEHILYVESPAYLTEPGSQLLPTEPVLPKDLQGLKRAEKYVTNVTAVVAAARATKRAAAKTLAALGATCLVVAEDGVGGNLAWIAAARERKLPVYVLPYEYSGRKQAEVAIAASPDEYLVKDWPARIFSWLKPQWRGRVNGKAVLRLPLRFALGYELAGIAPAKPWTVHGGRGTVLLAESDQMRSHYRAEGISTSKIRETGALAFDDLFGSIRPNARSQLRVLCALPPDYTSTHGPMPYDQLVRLWVQEAKRQGIVTVQAHPAARAKLQDLGYEPDGRDIAELIGQCDVLVTSVSSVIRLALAAGKPVINFDAYRFDYDDYKVAPGVRTSSNFVEFQRDLTALADPQQFSALTAAAEQDARRWGKIDGQAGARVMAILRGEWST